MAAAGRVRRGNRTVASALEQLVKTLRPPRKLVAGELRPLIGIEDAGIAEPDDTEERGSLREGVAALDAKRSRVFAEDDGWRAD
jgi:hypothetical protein